MRQRKKHQYLTLYQNWNRTPVYLELAAVSASYVNQGLLHVGQPGLHVRGRLLCRMLGVWSQYCSSYEHPRWVHFPMWGKLSVFLICFVFSLCFFSYSANTEAVTICCFTKLGSKKTAIFCLEIRRLWWRLAKKKLVLTILMVHRSTWRPAAHLASLSWTPKTNAFPTHRYMWLAYKVYKKLD